jgi:hypothetical protein
MLGQITRDLGDVAKRLEPTREFAAEWKYDGQRVQIRESTHFHRKDSKLTVSLDLKIVKSVREAKYRLAKAIYLLRKEEANGSEKTSMSGCSAGI